MNSVKSMANMLFCLLFTKDGYIIDLLFRSLCISFVRSRAEPSKAGRPELLDSFVKSIVLPPLSPFIQSYGVRSLIMRRIQRFICKIARVILYVKTV